MKMVKEFKENEAVMQINIERGMEVLDTVIGESTKAFQASVETLVKKASDEEFMEFINDKTIEMNLKMMAIAMRSGKKVNISTLVI